jgi:hypothetical protein
MLGAVIFMVAQPDVRLRMSEGEVVGWVSMTQSRDSDGHTRYTASVDPLVHSPKSPRKFTRFSSGTGTRLYAACQARGLDPFGRHFPDLPEAMKQPVGPVFRPQGMGAPGVIWDRRQVLCRLHYAGVFRRVVYDFEEFRPEDEDRLRRKLGGGRFLDGPMRRPAPRFVPRR